MSAADRTPAVGGVLRAQWLPVVLALAVFVAACTADEPEVAAPEPVIASTTAAPEEPSAPSTTAARTIADGDTVHVSAATCGLADVQAAVDAIYETGGGTLHVPAGECRHLEALRLPDGISLIGAGQDVTVIRDATIRFDTRHVGELDAGFRLSGMSLLGDSHIQLDTVHDFRVDHITLETASGSGIQVSNSRSGVIDHVHVKVEGSYYGIVVTGNHDEFPECWAPIEEVLGRGDAIFIEDSVIEGSGSYHSTVGHGAAHYVVRHSLIMGNIDAHGPGWGPPCGTRLVEVYNNTFQGPAAKGVGQRGGSSVIYGNTFVDYDNGIAFHLDSRADEYPPEMRVHESWVWDNTFEELGYGHEAACPGKVGIDYNHCIDVGVWGIGPHPGLDDLEEIQEDRDYFLRRPTQADDGFTYAPYPYPHPMTQS